jgi:uncharacterized protein YutE (UPF0331/DUF86 family)
MDKELREYLKRKVEENRGLQAALQKPGGMQMGDLLKAYGEVSSVVLIASTTLESTLDSLIMGQLAALDSAEMKYLIENEDTGVNQKMRFLQFAGVIDGDDYRDLRILFDIRNSFAHRFFGKIDLRALFARMDSLRIQDASARGMPNGADKFLYLANFHARRLLEKGRVPPGPRKG